MTHRTKQFKEFECHGWNRRHSHSRCWWRLTDLDLSVPRHWLTCPARCVQTVEPRRPEKGQTGSWASYRGLAFTVTRPPLNISPYAENICECSRVSYDWACARDLLSFDRRKLKVKRDGTYTANLFGLTYYELLLFQSRALLSTRIFFVILKSSLFLSSPGM